MEEPRAAQHIERQLIGRQHHVGARVAVEGKVPVAVGEGLDEGQRRVDPLIHAQIVHADPGALRRLAQLPAEHVLSDLAD